MRNKITYTVIELNKPSIDAVINYNKIANMIVDNNIILKKTYKSKKIA